MSNPFAFERGLDDRSILSRSAAYPKLANRGIGRGAEALGFENAEDVFASQMWDGRSANGWRPRV